MSSQPAPTPRVFVTLPAYNEERSLPPMLRDFEDLLRNAAPGAWTIIVVDDGSRDKTAQVIEDEARTGRLPLVLVRHEKNRGLGEAIKTGLRRALEEAGDDDMIVSLDADNTHPPDTIPRMLDEMAREKADLVIASRYRRGSQQMGVPLFRQVLSLGARILFRLFLGLPGVRDYTCGFRAYRGSLLRRAFERYGDDIITRRGFACTDELLVHLATLQPRIREVPFILRYDRKEGRSKLELGVTVAETLKLLWRHRKELREAEKKHRS